MGGQNPICPRTHFSEGGHPNMAVLEFGGCSAHCSVLQRVKTAVGFNRRGFVNLFLAGEVKTA
jgi:hypothetical protein